LPEECKESFIVPGVIKQIVVNVQAYKFVNYIQNFIQHPAVEVNSIR